MNGFYPRGRLARGAWESVVDDSIAGWRHTGIRVAELTGGTVELEAGAIERIIVPLAGSFTVEQEDEATVLHGRASVFDGPTDVLYLPCGSGAVIRGTGRIAVAEAPTDEVTTAVRAGDIALVPSGFHGPAAAPPGYDLYYLNVMAGPGERAWIITDDPRHAWIRETWKEEDR